MRPLRAAALGGAAALALTALAGSSALASTASAAHPARSARCYGLGALAQVRDRFISTTIDPVTGDINPYGVAVVPVTANKLVAGDVLVSDFNTFAGTAGAGSSIVQVNPSTGQVSDFAHGGPLTGADSLTFNPKGIVWAGDFGPAVGGVFSGADANVAVVPSTGAVAATFDQATTGKPFFNSVWGQAFGANSAGKVSFYWTNAGSSKYGGQVWRLDPKPTGAKNGQPINSTYTLLSTLPAGGTTAATAAGPQGEVYDAATDTLYVADDSSNAIYAIAHASIATHWAYPRLVLKGGPLNTPQGITMDPRTGRLFVVNGAGNNDLIELGQYGRVFGVRNLAPNEPAGALFGLAFDPAASTWHATVLYYVNDDENSLHVLTIASLHNRH
jgi:hypothetical protein